LAISTSISRTVIENRAASGFFELMLTNHIFYEIPQAGLLDCIHVCAKLNTAHSTCGAATHLHTSGSVSCVELSSRLSDVL